MDMGLIALVNQEETNAVGACMFVNYNITGFTCFKITYY